jgi:histidinol-phosphate aminotransferase
LIVLRTFSKWAGLAGLRIGYGAFPDELIPHLWKIKQPYNVSIAASAAALAALDDIPWLTETVAQIRAERARLSATLTDIPWLDPLPSQANFILSRVRGRQASELKTDLARQGILVRYFQDSGVEDCIRISVGEPEATLRLVAVLEEIGNRNE